MKVKVGNKIFDGEEGRIMVILTDKDKENIKNMHPSNTKYCAWPEDMYTKEEIEKWMEE